MLCHVLGVLLRLGSVSVIQVDEIIIDRVCLLVEHVL